MPRDFSEAGQSQLIRLTGWIKAYRLSGLQQIDANLVRHEHVGIYVVLAASMH